MSSSTRGDGAGHIKITQPVGARETPILPTPPLTISPVATRFAVKTAGSGLGTLGGPVISTHGTSCRRANRPKTVQRARSTRADTRNRAYYTLNAITARRPDQFIIFLTTTVEHRNHSRRLERGILFTSTYYKRYLHVSANA